METELTITWIVAILGTIIGVGSFVHIFFFINRNWSRTRGRVVGNFSEYTTSGTPNNAARRLVHFAEIAFTASDGLVYTVKGDLGKSREWPLGQTIELQYKPTNPEHAMTLNTGQTLLFSGAFALFGGLCWAVIFGWIG